MLVDISVPYSFVEVVIWAFKNKNSRIVIGFLRHSIRQIPPCNERQDLLLDVVLMSRK